MTKYMALGVAWWCVSMLGCSSSASEVAPSVPRVTQLSAQLQLHEQDAKEVVAALSACLGDASTFDAGRAWFCHRDGPYVEIVDRDGLLSATMAHDAEGKSCSVRIDEGAFQYNFGDEGCDGELDDCSVAILDGTARALRSLGTDWGCDGSFDADCGVAHRDAARGGLFTASDHNCDGEPDRFCQVLLDGDDENVESTLKDEDCDGRACVLTRVEHGPDTTRTMNATDDDCDGVADSECVYDVWSVAAVPMPLSRWSEPACDGHSDFCDVYFSSDAIGSGCTLVDGAY